MRIKIINTLSNIDNSIEWCSRIKSYNKKHTIFIEDNNDFLGTVENLILYIEKAKLNKRQKEKILYEIYKTQNKQLKKDLLDKPSKVKKQI
jgi:hypothetical protein